MMDKPVCAQMVQDGKVLRHCARLGLYSRKGENWCKNHLPYQPIPRFENTEVGKITVERDALRERAEAAEERLAEARNMARHNYACAVHEQAAHHHDLGEVTAALQMTCEEYKPLVDDEYAELLAERGRILEQREKDAAVLAAAEALVQVWRRWEKQSRTVTWTDTQNANAALREAVDARRKQEAEASV